MALAPTSTSKVGSGGLLSFRTGAAMLLLCYIVVFVYSPVGVPHIHHEDEIHQGDACQTDACHISVYHPGMEGRCNHKSHITRAKEECDLCNVVLPRQVLSTALSQYDFDIAFSFRPAFIDHISPAVEVHQHADRGPPYFIS